MSLQETIRPTVSREDTEVETSVQTCMLSVLVPVYNERDSILRIIEKVLSVPMNLEVIVVDDGSSDGTREILKNWRGDPRVEVLFHDHNRGKGAAIRTGLANARGEYVIIQDADLEYDPDDFPMVIGPLCAGDAQVVYGSRYLSPVPGDRFRLFRYGVSVLNLVVRVLYGQRLTDSATCYKAAPTNLLRSLQLECQRFEFCPEMTSKLCRLKIPILEVPISYSPRSKAEGKKIGVRDGWEALVVYWKYRKWNLNR